MAHIHDVIDTDVHYKIDGITRTITNINKTKRELVQNDHNSERFTFELPRYIDTHDMLTCNSVQVHYVNVDKYGKIKQSGIYVVDDLKIKPNDDSTVLLSWLVSGDATQFVGTLNFSIRFACVDNDEVNYVWNTTVFSGISILAALYNSSESIVPKVDVLTVYKDEIIAEILAIIRNEL
jgi:hypothetical protein